MPSLITHGAGGAGSSSQYQKTDPYLQDVAAAAQQYQQQVLLQQDQYRAKEHPGHVSTLILFCYMCIKSRCPRWAHVQKVGDF